MIMWMLIFSGLIIGTIAGVIYLASRFAAFDFVKRAAKGRRALRFLIGAAMAVAVVVITGLLFGTISAEIGVIHLVVIWLICDLIGLIAEKRRRKKFTRYYAGIAALAITFVYLAAGWYQAHHVWRTAYTVETDKPVGSLRIVQFADSHVGNTFSGAGFLEHVRAMQEEDPDIVVVTGDYVDDDTSKEDMIAACEALGTLETTYGVYFVFGNHDKGYYSPEHRGYTGDDLIRELEKNGVTVLQDETVPLGSGFYLIGRKDRSEEQRSGGRASMEELTSGLDRDRYSIVLDHQPGDYEAQTAAGVDLVLSGHTHGGQFFPINDMGQILGVDDKTYGLERRGDTDFIVTSGISDWSFQFKTGCRSEYVVVDIQGAA